MSDPMSDGRKKGKDQFNHEITNRIYEIRKEIEYNLELRKSEKISILEFILQDTCLRTLEDQYLDYSQVVNDEWPYPNFRLRAITLIEAILILYDPDLRITAFKKNDKHGFYPSSSEYFEFAKELHDIFNNMDFSDTFLKVELDKKLSEICSDPEVVNRMAEQISHIILLVYPY